MKDEKKKAAKKSSSHMAARRDAARRAAGHAPSSFILHPSSLPLVAVLMGSKSDWETMRAASGILDEFAVAHECRVISAHRTPALAAEFATSAEGRVIVVIL